MGIIKFAIFIVVGLGIYLFVFDKDKLESITDEIKDKFEKIDIGGLNLGSGDKSLGLFTNKDKGSATTPKNKTVVKDKKLTDAEKNQQNIEEYIILKLEFDKEIKDAGIRQKAGETISLSEGLSLKLKKDRLDKLEKEIKEFDRSQ